MGLFSSKKKTYVATQVMRAIEDDTLPNTLKHGLVKALFSDGSLSEHMLEGAINSVAVRADRMYDYAEKSYSFGLPSGESYTATQGKAVAQTILDTLEGVPVSLEYFRYGPPNNLHIGWMRLVEQHGYNPATNELTLLSAEKGKKVYLKNLEVVVPISQKDNYESGALSQWGTSPAAGYTPDKQAQAYAAAGSLASPTPVVFSTLATEEYVLATYIIDSPETVTVYQDEEYKRNVTYPEGTITIPTSDVDDLADFFHAKYSVGGVTKYWMYQAKEGTYPALDAFFESPPTELGSFYPIAYFRHDKTRMDTDKTSTEYKTSQKMLKYIGVDYQAMIDAIHDSPDIADVEQAMLMMAVPANTTNPVELKYLFDFFESQYYTQDAPPKATSSTNVYKLFVSNNEGHGIVIQDKRAKFVLNHRGIVKKRLAGSIGPIGSYTGSTGEVQIETNGVEETVDSLRVAVSRLYAAPIHYYRKQITESLYDEVQIIDLRMTYNVWGGYNTVGDETDDILLIPIDRNITQAYWVGDKETLYARSLHYIFNSRKIVKVKWYQQSWFTTLLKIAAIVITVVSLGTQNWSLAIATSLATSSAMVLAIAIALDLIAMQLIGQAFQLFVKAVGKDLAFLTALVAAAYGINGVIEAGGFQAAAPMAKDLLSLANGMVSSIGASYQEDMANLMGEYSEFNKYIEEQTKLLDKAEDSLRTSNLLSPFTIFGESPDDFYKRTIHSGNIGTIGVDSIENYVERSLTLPTITDTLGEYDYGPAA